MKTESPSYQSNDLFTTVVLVFFPLYLLLKIFFLLSYIYSVHILNNFISSPSELVRANFVSSLNFGDNLARYDIILFILCAVSFSLWIHRANKNLSFLDVKGLEFSPALSVWSFYIPFICLYWPFKAVSEIWKASQPNDDNIGRNWKKFSTPLIIPIWWILFIGAGILGRIINSYTDLHSLPEIKTYLLELIVLELLLAIATILIIYIVYKINQNQNNKLMVSKLPAQNN